MNYVLLLILLNFASEFDYIWFIHKQNFLIVFRGANKQDEALECYGRAANLYKMAKKWSLAGQTFVTIATHHSKAGGKHDAATNFVDAANCFKKSDPKGKTKYLLHLANNPYF